MAYFVFDLDSTLADVSAIYYCIAGLKIKAMLNGFMAAIFPDKLDTQLDTAYQLFVKAILKEEESDKPIGILRPGILPIMKKLAALKKRGRITSVIIYSNNRHLESLEFIRDLIHEHVGSRRLISDCIHWDHPLRNEEKWLYPQMYPKTWRALSSIIMNSRSHQSTRIMPKDVYFFDDQDHVDLQLVLQRNYYKVPAYNFHETEAQVHRIYEMYVTALQGGNVAYHMLMEQIYEVFYDQEVFLSPLSATAFDIVRVIHELSGKIQQRRSSMVGTDRGLEMMQTAIDYINTNHMRMHRQKYARKTLTYKKRRRTNVSPSVIKS